MTKLIRIYIHSEIELNKQIELNDKDSHYVNKVMRKKIGEQLYIFNGREGEWIAEIISINKRSTIILPIEKVRQQNKNSDINLIFAPVKNSKINFIIEKITELGVTKIFPIISDRSIVKDFNIEKANITMIEAIEQCERIDLVEIFKIDSLSNLINSWDRNNKILFCNERKIGNFIIDELKNDSDINTVLIGPEGGFSDREYKLLENDFIIPVHLGSNILKSETAIIASISILSFSKNQL